MFRWGYTSRAQSLAVNLWPLEIPMPADLVGSIAEYLRFLAELPGSWRNNDE